MTGVCVGWVLNIVRLNNEAVQLSLLAAGADNPAGNVVAATTAFEENISASSTTDAEDDDADWSDEDFDAVDGTSEEDEVVSDADTRA